MKSISLLISCLLVALLSSVAVVNSSVTVAHLWDVDIGKPWLDSWTIGPDNNVYYLSANHNDPTIYKIDTTTNTKVVIKIMSGITSDNFWEGINYYDGYIYFATTLTIYRLNFNNPSSNHEVFKTFSEDPTIHQINIDKSTGRMAIGFTSGKTLIYDFNTNSMLGITLPFGNVVFHPLTHDLFMVTGYNLVKYVVSGNSYSTTPQIVKNLGSYLASYWSVAIRNEKFFYPSGGSYYMYDFTTNQITNLATVSSLESGIIAPNGKIYIGGGSGVYVITLSADCSSLNNCNGQGTCIADGVCMCNPGWAGNSQCSAHSCEAVNNCGGHGTCSKPNTCVCTDGWSGNSCQTAPVTGPDCSALNNCNGHGTCTGNNQCTCNSGWKGNAECSLPSCDGVNNCNGQGTCSGPNTCTCNSGWKGDAQCSVPSCDGVNNCNGQGTCSGPNTCTCNSGWNGDAQCSVPSCENLNGCNGNGVCSGPNVCTCNSGWKGNSSCSAYSCDLVGNCVNNGACTGPNICTCPNPFKENSFGAPKPIIEPFYNSGTKQFGIMVTMSNSSTASVYHFAGISTTKKENANCENSQPDISPFTVAEKTNCGTSYKYQFSTADVFSNNSPFVVTVSQDGNGLIASTFLASIYSVHREDVCTLSQFDSKLQFKFSLTPSETEFTSVDKVAKLVVTRVWIDETSKKLKMTMKVTSTFDKVADFKDFSLSKSNVVFGVKTNEISCGTVCKIMTFESAGEVSGILDDTYSLAFKMDEKDASNKVIANTRDVTIPFDLIYTVPSDAASVVGDSITSTISNYVVADGSLRPAISYSTTDNVLLGNKIDNNDIIVPSGYKFTPYNAVICCVNGVSGSFPYSEGCAGDSYTRKASLVTTGTVQNNVVVSVNGDAALDSKTPSAKEYFLKFKINSLLSGISANPEVCRVHIESRFTGSARNIQISSLLKGTVKTQRIIRIEQTETQEGNLVEGNTVSFIMNPYVISSAIVSVTAVLSTVFVGLVLVALFYKKHKNAENVQQETNNTDSSNIELKEETV